MDTGVQVAYYANGNVIYLPYTDSSRLALEYIAKRDPSYIVLHSIAKAPCPTRRGGSTRAFPIRGRSWSTTRVDRTRTHQDLPLDGRRPASAVTQTGPVVIAARRR